MFFSLANRKPFWRSLAVKTIRFHLTTTSFAAGQMLIHPPEACCIEPSSLPESGHSRQDVVHIRTRELELGFNPEAIEPVGRSLIPFGPHLHGKKNKPKQNRAESNMYWLIYMGLPFPPHFHQPIIRC